MYGTMKRHEIQVLKQAGLFERDVAEVAGVSRRTVQRVAKEPPAEAKGKARRTRGVGRPSTVERYRKFVVEVLAQELILMSAKKRQKNLAS